MSRMPLISIIIPVYNVELYLRRCIDSILAQTFTDFECIIINDGSSDGSHIICDEYATVDKRIVVIHQKNEGVSAARNAGLAIAHGEWIGFVDGDDWCDVGMFRALYENALKYDADVSICGFRIIKNNNEKSGTQKKRVKLILNGKKATLKMLLPNHFGAFSWNKLIKKKIICKYKLRYKTAIKYREDLLFFFEVFKVAERVVYISTPYYNYFHNSESVTLQKGITEAVKTAFVAFDSIILSEKCSKIKKRVMIKKALFASTISKYFILHKNYQTEDYYYCQKIILCHIDIVLLDFSISLKQKIVCCLVLYPRLMHYIMRVLKNENI